MTPNLLILGGTLDASALGKRLAETDVQVTVSMAGRVARPKEQPLPLRIGGFGGVDGLAAYLTAQNITHVIDATHPFAAQMSRNAVTACAQVGIPLAALARPAWQAQTGDRWTHVPDIPAAAASLTGAAKRVMLAVGRMHLAEFAVNPQHNYLLRLVDAPEEDLPLPNTIVEVARGPFDVAGDTALMQRHGIEMVVSKNSGGRGAVAKITAARQLGLPVLMIDRPAVPDRQEVHDVDAVLDWLTAHGVDLGV